jgi:hypothetical protein
MYMNELTSPENKMIRMIAQTIAAAIKSSMVMMPGFIANFLHFSIS